ncbi:hypothetical protein S40288_08093 [Stachybotrys chartarum IBT 40288]|nr:hypothetical protein S40288_08093 [Stachybotrys chartarum IBT 40288]
MKNGGLPEWWETECPLGPLANVNQWDILLKKTGFGGIDTVTPETSASLAMKVIVSQAVNDQATLLRSPLGAKERPAGVRNDGLAIIGGLSSPVHRLSRQVHDILDHCFQNKQFFDTVLDFASSPMPLSSSMDDTPHSYTMTGILHTVMTENPRLNIQIYDLDSGVPGTGIETSTAEDLTITPMRQHLFYSWDLGNVTETVLWSKEPEVFQKNARYSSQRRDVHAEADPNQDRLALVGAGGREYSLELQKVSLLTAAPRSTTSTRRIKIEQSMLQSIVCLRISEETLLGNAVSLCSQSGSIINLLPKLEQAWDGASQGLNKTSVVLDSVQTLSLNDISSHASIGDPLSTVDWTSAKSVTAKIVPIDSGTLFRLNRTYFFAGMAGELGQSFAEWLITYGARFVVLSSRNPKVNPKFITDMKKQHGAVVQIMSVDVKSRESLQLAHAVISAALPPIAGVLNGAMIPDDDLFSNMMYEQFTRVTRPKVVGFELLDELFYDTSLDFFAIASSVASVIGFSGQSNYAAASLFMTGLMHNRRKRGVAGSSISIPGVLGLGVAANAANFDFEYFQSIGYINISEVDLQVLFAEAVLSGRAGSDAYVEVAMGVNHVPADLPVNDAHRRDAKFKHFIPNESDRTALDDTRAGGKSSMRVKTQVQKAKTWDEAYAATKDAFLRHLGRMLRINKDGKIEERVALIDQGVDSHVAVDIRAWLFLEELAVDVPTLKVLGGGSVANLVKAALDKTPGIAQQHAAPEPARALVPAVKATFTTAPSSPPRSRGRSLVSSSALSEASGSGAATSPVRLSVADEEVGKGDVGALGGKEGGVVACLTETRGIDLVFSLPYIGT